MDAMQWERETPVAESKSSEQWIIIVIRILCTYE